MADRIAVLEGRGVPYTVRRSRRARRLRLVVQAAQHVEIVLPVGYRLGNPVTLLEENAKWIVHQLDRLAGTVIDASAGLEPGTVLLVGGKEYRLAISYPAPAARVHLDSHG